MTVSRSTTLRNTVVDTVSSVFSEFSLYTSPRPASADDAATGTLLVSITLSGWNAASGGTADVAATASAAAVATGTAEWGRFTNGFGQSVDGTVSVAGGGGDWIVNTVNVVTGGTVSLLSAPISVPA